MPIAAESNILPTFKNFGNTDTSIALSRFPDRPSSKAWEAITTGFPLTSAPKEYWKNCEVGAGGRGIWAGQKQHTSGGSFDLTKALENITTLLFTRGCSTQLT